VVEEITQLHPPAGFILECVMKRQGAVEILIDTGMFLPGWRLLRSRPDGLVSRVLRLNGADGKEKTKADDGKGEAWTNHSPAYAANVPFQGSGRSTTVFPVWADCRAASRICITTMLVSSELRSWSGSTWPRMTAAR